MALKVFQVHVEGKPFLFKEWYKIMVQPIKVAFI